MWVQAEVTTAHLLVPGDGFPRPQASRRRGGMLRLFLQPVPRLLRRTSKRPGSRCDQHEPVEGEHLRGRARQRRLLPGAPRGGAEPEPGGWSPAAAATTRRGLALTAEGARRWPMCSELRTRSGARSRTRPVEHPTGSAPEQQRRDPQAAVVFVGEIEPRPVRGAHERAAAALGGLDGIAWAGRPRRGRRARHRRRAARRRGLAATRHRHEESGDDQGKERVSSEHARTNVPANGARSSAGRLTEAW